MKTINKKNLIKSCKKIGVAKTAEELCVSGSWIYKLTKGIKFNGRKRSGRKKKITLI